MYVYGSMYAQYKYMLQAVKDLFMATRGKGFPRSSPLLLEGVSGMVLGIPLKRLVCESSSLHDPDIVEVLVGCGVADLDLMVYCTSNDDFAHGGHAYGK